MNLSNIIHEYLSKCREITNFCTQNGWIDDSTLEFEIIEHNPQEVLIAVKFVEMVMCSSGCGADRVSCFGKLKLLFDETGQVKSAIEV